MDRLISEQDVIDAMAEALKHGEGVHNLLGRILAIPSAEPNRDMEEIEEVINCDANAETKCKMISNILLAKPHYFELPSVNPQELIDCANAEHDADGCLGYSTNRGGYSYCQTCLECPKASINNWDKEQEPSGDAVSRQALLDAFGLSEKTRKWGGDHSGYDTMMLYEIQDMIESAPSVKPQPICEEREKGECPWYAG